MAESRYALSIDQIRRFLPHRAPFLLVDRILEIEPKGDLANRKSDSSKEGLRVVGVKNVTFNEPCFTGHFPDFSIYPGVLIIESMAQVACFSLYPYLESDPDQLRRGFQCILVGLDNVRFRRPVLPGDTMRFETVVTRCRGKLWLFHVEVTVEGQKAAEADLLANLLVKGETP